MSCYGRAKNGCPQQGRGRARCPEQDRDRSQCPLRGRSKARHPNEGRGIKSPLSRAGVNPGTWCGQGAKAASPGQEGKHQPSPGAHDDKKPPKRGCGQSGCPKHRLSPGGRCKSWAGALLHESHAHSPVAGTNGKETLRNATVPATAVHGQLPARGRR